MNANAALQLVGTIPNETGFRKRARFHQGWWRAFVLNEPEGANPARQEDRVCNTIRAGETSGKNFLSSASLQSVEETRLERMDYQAGLFNEDRLFNNLLSSQPLAFNFFGPLKQDSTLATMVLKPFLPEGSIVTGVFFEFAPKEKYSGDNSAFDVAIEFETGSKKGLLGLECKYTDSFSVKEYSKESYRTIFAASPRFGQPYESFISSRFNQLFRGQLIAESLVQNGKYDFVLTGLFCFQDDVGAIEIGNEFQGMLNDGKKYFQVITYADFVAALQKLDISWEMREWSMLLWARYCGLKMSDELFRLGGGN